MEKLKLTKAQRPYLELCPDEWTNEPLWPDERPVRAMARHGLIERRSIPVEEIFRDIWTYRAEWRITKSGRAALEASNE